jgi:hypothetical protein
MLDRKTRWVVLLLALTGCAQQPRTRTRDRDAQAGGATQEDGSAGPSADGPAVGGRDQGSSQASVDASVEAAVDAPAGAPCPSDQHRCAGECVSNFDVLTCGHSCELCSPPGGALSTCDGQKCDFVCQIGKRCGYGCTTGCCADADCPPQGNLPQRCNSAHQCELRCDPDGRLCQGACLPNTVCCDGTCPGNAACVANACSPTACRPGFRRCSDGCVEVGLAGRRACCEDRECGRCQMCSNGVCHLQAPGPDRKDDCHNPRACLTGECDAQGLCVKLVGTICAGPDIIFCGKNGGQDERCPNNQCAVDHCLDCGGLGQSCCGFGHHCNTGLSCQNDPAGADKPPVCRPCGATGQPCCEGLTCGTNLTCKGYPYICEPCGAAGQTCCENDTCSGATLACNSSSRCEACGDRNQLCCPQRRCNSSALTCQTDRCGL